MKVVVQELFQVTHDGVDYRPGDKAEVPDEIAGTGWVDPADAAAKKLKGDIAAGLVNPDSVDENGHPLPEASTDE